MLKNKFLSFILLLLSLTISFSLLTACVGTNPGQSSSNPIQSESTPDQSDNSSSEEISTGGETTAVMVTFYNEDYTLIYEEEVERGTAPVYKGEAPVKQSTPSTEYEFAGWLLSGSGNVYKELPVVDVHSSFVAQFTEKAREYTITFSVNGVDHSAKYEYGQKPVYEGEARFEIGDSIYVISGWDKVITEVTGDCTYVAILTYQGPVSYYEVTFVVDESSLTQTVRENTVPTFFGEPYRKEVAECSYRFIGWQCENTLYTTLPVATKNVTYVAVFEAVYKQFMVTFKQDGEVVQQSLVNYGEVPAYSGEQLTKPSDSKYDYSLSGWRKYGEVYYGELPCVYEDMTFDAVFEKTLRNYNVTVNYYLNGELLNTYTQNYICGDDCEIISPVVSGYAPSMAYISGCVVEDIVYNVHYNSFDVWNGEYERATLNGEGSEQSPYIITTAKQLAQLALDVDGGNSYEGKYFKLNNDLDLASLAWEAIGHYNYPFAGHFDGNGHSIFNLYYRSTLGNNDENSGHALFSTVSGSVKNLNVSGDVASVAKYTALVVGHNKGGLVEGCNSFGLVCGFGNTAGIVGWSSGEIKNCNNYATITQNGNSGSYRTAGVVGGTNASVTYCNNYGKVIVDGGTGTVAGVVARKEGSAIISYCNNYGYISSTKNYNGGIVGYAKGEAESIQNCYNYAPIYGSSYTSGIVGYIIEGSVKSCINYGLIKGSSYVGGVVGYTNNDVYDCENLGGIYGTSNYVGGVIGRTYGTTLRCVNRGDVYGKASSVGGIAGYMNVRSDLTVGNEMRDCVNYAEISAIVTGDNANCGGIVGVVAKLEVDGGYVKPLVENCVNYGIVLSTANYTGGVAGGCNGAIMRNCVNHAYVISEGGAYVAGIAGSNWGYGLVTTCTNYGAILGGSTVGQICGQLTDTSTAVGNTSLGKIL